MTALPRRRSIRARLATLYTGLLAVALLLFCSGVYVVLRAELVRSFDEAVLASAEHAAGAFALDVDGTGNLAPSRRLLDQLGSTGGRAVVFGADGGVLVDSAPSSAEPLPIGPVDLEGADRHPHEIREVVIGDAAYRLTIEPVVAAGGERVGYVAWAASTADLVDLLGTLLTALVAGGVLVVGLAFGAGWILARGALAPVADVTETARAIALSGDFGARVDAGQAGDEVGELAIAFNEMLAALEQNHQTLQRFLGDASHQLRTPVTTMRANLDLAQRPGLPDAERAAILADARDEAERMGRLIGDLLALARAESGARLEFAPVELDALLVESVRHERHAAPDVRMSVSSVEPASVDGDRDRLRDLLGILLDNAARYTPAGGSVVAALEVRDRRAIVRVEDTGIGIDEADRKRLFERLYRGARAREMRPSGTGLGLAIARWIVESHGGTIELAGRETGGTVATVTLPLRSP